MASITIQGLKMTYFDLNCKNNWCIDEILILSWCPGAFW